MALTNEILVSDAKQNRLSVKEAAYRWHLFFEDETPTERDRKAFERWLSEDPDHRDAYDRATVAWDAFDELRGVDLGLDRPGSSTVPEDTNSAKLSLRHQSAITFFGWKSLKLGIPAVAAVFCLLVYVGFSRNAPVESRVSTSPAVTAHQTALGQSQTIQLSDGTRVVMGPLTSIAVTMGDKRRDVSLQGGAVVFDVWPDANRPFTVTADSIEAKAIGTVFEVRSNGGVIRVAVEEGSVELARPWTIAREPTGSLSRRLLDAGDYGAVALSTDEVRFGQFEIKEFAAWRESRLNFESATLLEIIDETNRYSTRKIVIEGDIEPVRELTMTGFFNADSIDQILSTLAAVFPVEIYDDGAGGPIVVRLQ